MGRLGIFVVGESNPLNKTCRRSKATGFAIPFIMDLPSLLLSEIAQHLDRRDTVELRLACRRWDQELTPRLLWRVGLVGHDDLEGAGLFMNHGRHTRVLHMYALRSHRGGYMKRLQGLLPCFPNIHSLRTEVTGKKQMKIFLRDASKLQWLRCLTLAWHRPREFNVTVHAFARLETLTLLLGSMHLRYTLGFLRCPSLKSFTCGLAEPAFEIFNDILECFPAMDKLLVLRGADPTHTPSSQWCDFWVSLNFLTNRIERLDDRAKISQCHVDSISLIFRKEGFAGGSREELVHKYFELRAQVRSGLDLTMLLPTVTHINVYVARLYSVHFQSYGEILYRLLDFESVHIHDCLKEIPSGGRPFLATRLGLNLDCWMTPEWAAWIQRCFPSLRTLALHLRQCFPAVGGCFPHLETLELTDATLDFLHRMIVASPNLRAVNLAAQFFADHRPASDFDSQYPGIRFGCVRPRHGTEEPAFMRKLSS